MFITPGGRFRLTAAYDVLTAQPSLDTGRINRKQFGLAMSVGKSRHYDIHGIVPWHFLQTADLAGVGIPAVRSIIEDLGDAAQRKATAVIELLPQDFPGQLVESAMTTINERLRLLAALNAGAVRR